LKSADFPTFGRPTMATVPAFSPPDSEFMGKRP
jgi:hypothetical protein